MNSREKLILCTNTVHLICLLFFSRSLTHFFFYIVVQLFFTIFRCFFFPSQFYMHEFLFMGFIPSVHLVVIRYEFSSYSCQLNSYCHSKFLSTYKILNLLHKAQPQPRNQMHGLIAFHTFFSSLSTYVARYEYICLRTVNSPI